MKKINLSIFLSALILLAVSCIMDPLDSISGDGKVTSQTRDLPEFSGVKVGSGIDVFLTQGEPQSVVVEADENLQEWIRTEVNGNVLRIFTDKTIRFAKTKKVHITCKTLDQLDISSAGDVTSINRFKTGNLRIDLSSAGDLKFEVDADEIDLSMSSAGNADLKGTANKLRADLSSAGDLNAFDLEAKIGDVSVSSAGNARVFVTEEASFRSSSAGSIHYKGEPKIKNISTSSAGSVNKRD
ncbi:MAG TPA: head GIN domain-containing protein [Bacteroidales bacterium]|jgi:hypothetical protein|nr:head GIN domain-containing protein [Bacteroidales bacterium]